MNPPLKRGLRALACVSMLLGAATSANAANWLMLQGTEHPKAPPQKFWGFIQPTYVNNRGDKLSGQTGPFAANNGKYVAQNVAAPEYEDTSDLNFRRARFGVRGKFTGAFKNSFTEKMNFFTLFEVAPNLLTYDPFGDRARTIALDHASLTFNHIPGARVRAGLFKTPGPEELLQAIHTFDYIEFTDFIAREQLERFVTGNYGPAGSPGTTVGTPVNTSYGFNAARDWGIQVFDSFKRGKWDLSYAVMVGRGEAISERHDSDNNYETYLYASAEYDLPGGRGPKKNGIKFYGWHQKGKREFESDPSSREYDRIRYGIGVKALGKLFGSKYKHRISAELMYANGMIFLAPAGNVAHGNVANSNLQYAAEKGNKARGITLDYGFYLDKHWQFDVRWDRDEILYQTSSSINPGNERVVTGTTLGVTYHFNPKTRLTFNYIKRDAKAPTNYVPGAGYNAALLDSNVETIVDSLDDRIALQLTWIF